MKRLSRNFLSIIGSDVARRVLGFFTVAFLARTVGTAGFGAINIGFTIFSYALSISSAGLGSMGTRAIARGEDDSMVSRIVSLRLVSGSIAFIIVTVVAIVFISNSTTVFLVVVFCAALFVHAFFLEWFFQGREEMGIVGFGRALSAAGYLAVVLAFVHSPESIVWVAIASGIGDLLATCTLLIVLRRRNNETRIRFTLVGWKALLRQAFPIGIGGMMANISVNFPLIAIGIILSNSDVGVYSAANKMVVFLLMFDRVIATLLLPASARLHAQSHDALSMTLTDALRWIVIIAIPISIGGLVLADRIVPMVFGEQYQSAVLVFRILIWFFFFTMIHTVYSSGLIAIGKEKMYGTLMVISGLLYAVLVTVGTIYFGVMGAAIAVVVAEAATLLLMRRRFQQFVSLHIPRTILSAILCGVLMGVVLVWLPPLHVILAVLLGAVMYVVLLFVTRGITVNDVSNILKRV